MPSTSKVPEEIKEKAVSLRLSGLSLREVSAQTGMSLSAISMLVSAYKKNGAASWEGVKRGRPAGGNQSAIATYGALKQRFLTEREPEKSYGPVFTTARLAEWINKNSASSASEDERFAKRRLLDWGLMPPAVSNTVSTLYPDDRHVVYWFRGPRGELLLLPSALPVTDDAYCELFAGIKQTFPKGLSITLNIPALDSAPKLMKWLQANPTFSVNLPAGGPQKTPDPHQHAQKPMTNPLTTGQSRTPQGLTHLQRLEAEAITIMREVVAEANNPVMLYSIGKDSAVMLHLAVKAFYPAKIPFPLLHVDTTWKFKEMYRFREQMQQKHDFKLLVHVNQEGLAQGINPFTHGSHIHTDVMKTVALKQALDQYKFDVAFGGARRDEEKSRAKERIFSFRTKEHRWDPKNQRPELWALYNAKKHPLESIRVFPLSNWTELDIWQYIYLESIPIVPLYFSAPRPVVSRNGTLIMVDDDRMPLLPNEVPMIRNVRFRTLGCYPLTGAIESNASNLEEIIQEMLLTKTSERQGRMIDHDSAASMEKKKQEGYF